MNGEVKYTMIYSFKNHCESGLYTILFPFDDSSNDLERYLFIKLLDSALWAHSNHVFEMGYGRMSMRRATILQ